MKYQYIMHRCSVCRKITKWQKECPGGIWYCTECKAKEKDNDKKRS